MMIREWLRRASCVLSQVLSLRKTHQPIFSRRTRYCPAEIMQSCAYLDLMRTFPARTRSFSAYGCGSPDEKNVRMHHRLSDISIHQWIRKWKICKRTSIFRWNVPSSDRCERQEMGNSVRLNGKEATEVESVEMNGDSYDWFFIGSSLVLGATPFSTDVYLFTRNRTQHFCASVSMPPNSPTCIISNSTMRGPRSPGHWYASPGWSRRMRNPASVHLLQ
mmetsp:Transcript_9031/g.18252  ORF Transcript_9031/g.18252 Transcript_9031/m.18252 type:complete len:219 (+) Transcript_9031:204-860(+)